jgi:hypothetical protein
VSCDHGLLPGSSLPRVAETASPPPSCTGCETCVKGRHATAGKVVATVEGNGFDEGYHSEDFSSDRRFRLAAYGGLGGAPSTGRRSSAGWSVVAQQAPGATRGSPDRSVSDALSRDLVVTACSNCWRPLRTTRKSTIALTFAVLQGVEPPQMSGMSWLPKTMLSCCCWPAARSPNGCLALCQLTWWAVVSCLSCITLIYILLNS